MNHLNIVSDQTANDVKLNINEMKKSICLLAFTGIVFSSLAQTPHYEITGKIDGAEGVKFVLQKNATGKMVSLDTVVVVNGMFKITGGSVEYPEMAYFATLDRKKSLSFFLENSNITITGKLESLADAKITGSKTQDEILPLLEFIKPLGAKAMAINAEIQAANKNHDAAKMSDLRKQMSSMTDEVKAAELKFVQKNPSSFAAPEILRSIFSGMQTSEVESIISAMDPAVAETPIIIDLKSKINTLKAVDLGKKAPDFTLNDPQGNKVSLSSKVGSKLLLIDFWAAWCGPCRAENPNVVKVYNEFHSKGFDILGVSLDRSRPDWNKAISDDKLTWTHVSDLQYWNSEAAKLYGVRSIPANFLLDKNGIIIAKNLRGEALYNKVKELVSTK